MKNGAYVVHASWDDEARVWVAESDDVPGLVAEAATVEKLMRKLRVLVPELLELNGRLPRRKKSAGISIQLIARYDERIRRSA
jgi:predicted RNase H-like HicB family nuclease